MESTSQIFNFKNDIELVNLNIYKLQSKLNVLELLTPVPSKVISALFNPELLEATTKASEDINRL